MRISFDEWMKRIDQLLIQKVGFGLAAADFEDQCYRGWYEDGMTPREAVAVVLNGEEF